MEFNEALSKSKLSRSRLSIEERINKNGLNTFNLSGKRT